MSNFHSKKMLMQNNCTLTVVTNPASATCTLTYDGVAHSEKSATVKSGTVISYSIHNATYGTTTGSITMNKNKTLTFTGTYSDSTVIATWSQPTLSANGTLGSGSFAVSASQRSSTYAVWKAFDGSISSNGNPWIPAQADTAASSVTPSNFYLTMSFSPKIRITSFKIYNRTHQETAPVSWSVYYSDNSNVASSPNTTSYWTFCGSGTNNNQVAGSSWTASLDTVNDFHKYYQIRFGTDWDHTSSSSRGILEIDITAKYQRTTYSYKWHTSVT